MGQSRWESVVNIEESPEAGRRRLSLDRRHEPQGLRRQRPARIAAAATDGGEIVTSSSVRSLLGHEPGFRFGETRTLQLKGVDGLHEISRLVVDEASPVDPDG
jgi:hypothetical protein